MQSSVKIWVLYTGISLSKIRRIENERKWEFFSVKLYEQFQYGDIVCVYSRKLSRIQFIATVVDAEMAFTAGVNSLEILRTHLDEDLLSSEDLPIDSKSKYHICDITDNDELLNLLKLKSSWNVRSNLEGSRAQYILSKRKKRGKKELILEGLIIFVITVFVSAFLFGDLLFFICAFLGLLGMAVLAIL